MNSKMSTPDIEGCVRNELEALSAGRDDNHEESQKLENAAVDLSAILEELTTIRASIPPKLDGQKQRTIQEKFK